MSQSTEAFSSASSSSYTWRSFVYKGGTCSESRNTHTQTPYPFHSTWKLVRESNCYSFHSFIQDPFHMLRPTTRRTCSCHLDSFFSGSHLSEAILAHSILATTGRFMLLSQHVPSYRWWGLSWVLIEPISSRIRSPSGRLHKIIDFVTLLGLEIVSGLLLLASGGRNRSNCTESFIGESSNNC